MFALVHWLLGSKGPLWGFAAVGGMVGAFMAALIAARERGWLPPIDPDLRRFRDARRALAKRRDEMLAGARAKPGLIDGERDPGQGSTGAETHV